MGVPKQKKTKSRKGSRRAHLKITPLNLSTCLYCNQPIRPHLVCPNCGYYREKKIIETKIKKPKSKTT